MYENLKSEMKSKGISQNQIAKLLGLHLNCVQRKISCGNRFYVDEALAIQAELFPEKEIEWLFAQGNEKR